MRKKEEQKNGGWIFVLLIAAFVIGRFSNAPKAETSTPRVSESSNSQSLLKTEPVAADDAADDNPVPEQSEVEATMPQPLAAPADAVADVYYPNCSAARAAGAAPIHDGEPGYAYHLDRDHDGVACE
ncbi:excalibur calcium-binding domain-containing protein [Sphingomonas sp. MMS24-J45]|uniref:excalibur calcium-binding domain-containing protein n=1 Tax=Sphingomonas sp. MMS24-J45 TaxID=3238806 RepID=UPI00384F07F9